MKSPIMLSLIAGMLTGMGNGNLTTGVVGVRRHMTRLHLPVLLTGQ